MSSGKGFSVVSQKLSTVLRNIGPGAALGGEGVKPKGSSLAFWHGCKNARHDPDVRSLATKWMMSRSLGR